MMGVSVNTGAVDVGADITLKTAVTGAREVPSDRVDIKITTEKASKIQATNNAPPTTQILIKRLLCIRLNQLRRLINVKSVLAKERTPGLKSHKLPEVQPPPAS